MTHLPAGSRLFVTIFLCWLSAVSSAADVASKSNLVVLEQLAKKFVEARSLPPGTRPVPPSIDLLPVMCMKLSALWKALGSPNERARHLPRCRASSCLSYTYGPVESLVSNPGPID